MTAAYRNALDYEAAIRVSQRPTSRPPVLDRRDSGIRIIEDTANTLIGKMVECFDRGDFLGAVTIAERLMSHRRIPIVIALKSQLQTYSLDHREGFILSLVDGHAPIEQLFDLAGMPMLEVLRLLCQLVEKRVVALVDAH